MSFTIFSELPAEIRLQIWEATLPNRRIVTIVGIPYERYSDLYGNQVSFDDINVQHSLDNTTLNAMYRACKDSHDTVTKASENGSEAKPSSSTMNMTSYTSPN